MLLEIRTYTIRSGHLAEFLDGYEASSLPIQQRHLGRLVGYFVPETGLLNQVVHLWAYEDTADRALRRAAMRADPGWPEVQTLLADLVERMESRFLTPAAFSPMHWADWPAGRS